MNLFINDIPVQILDASIKPDKSEFNSIINANQEPITRAKLLHRVWIKHAKMSEIEELLDLLDTTRLSGLISLVLTVEDYKLVKTLIKSKFKIIKAAGGLVKKKDKILMIYRLKKWDLPKGKFEKGEKSKEAGKREVEEECNIEVKLVNKICTTWHTYTMKRKRILKKTDWYAMKVVDDSKMAPQVEEDIEEVRWMTPKEVFHALEHSYQSIRFVFDTYMEAEKEKERAKS